MPLPKRRRRLMAERFVWSSGLSYQSQDFPRFVFSGILRGSCNFGGERRSDRPSEVSGAGWRLVCLCRVAMRKRGEMPPSLHPALGACWLAAPSERSPLFFPAFAAISLAIQGTLRERVPAACLLNSSVFEDTRFAYPMLVYQASRPFHGKGRADLTYDVLDEILMKRFYRRAKKKLGSVLADVVAQLQSDRREDLVRL